MKALHQHHEATGDERAIDAMRSFCRFLYRTIDDRPLYSWSKYRWGDLAVSIHRLYERTGETWLLELLDDVADQGYDWGTHWTEFDQTDPVNEGDEIRLDFSARLETVERGDGVALQRGPLVFSLPVDAEETVLEGEPPYHTREPPYHTREFRPTEPWNYAIDPDTAEIVEGEAPEPPISPEDAPVSVQVDGRRIPGWTTENNWAAPVPADPEPEGSTETLQLVPYGCTTLRVTEFPRLSV